MEGRGNVLRLGDRDAGSAASGVDLPEAPLTTLSIHLSLHLVVTGRFVAMLPRSIFHFNGTGRLLKVLPIKLPIQPRPVAIMSLKHRTLSPVAQRFIDCARTVAKPMSRGK